MELNLAVSWTGTQQLELYPAMCKTAVPGRPRYTGTAASEDVVMRISSEADGQDAVEGAREFARTLRRANVAPLTTDSGAQIAQAPHQEHPVRSRPHHVAASARHSGQRRPHLVSARELPPAALRVPQHRGRAGSVAAAAGCPGHATR
ncbi:DUF5998 family protein [Kocuria rhizophila]|nr:DUF5998 family protein [Kocuria rhizophila]